MGRPRPAVSCNPANLKSAVCKSEIRNLKLPAGGEREEFQIADFRLENFPVQEPCEDPFLRDLRDSFAIFAVKGFLLE
jgi:hypothetical protein